MNRTAFRALVSHWRRHPTQLLTLVMGLALATALWSGVQAINAEARASYDAAARAVGGEDRASLVDTDGGRISVETYVRLRRAGWQVSPVIEGDMPAGDGRTRLIGVDLLTDLPPALEGDAIGMEVEPADALGNPGRLFAARQTAERLDGPELPPVLTAPQTPPGIVLADIGVAARLLGRGDMLDRLTILPNQPKGLPPIEAIAPELERRAPGAQADVARLTDSFHLNLTAFGFLSFAVGLFIVNGAVGLAFEQRRTTFRTLRALGLPIRHLLALLGVELLGLALLAGAVGMVLGGLIAAALLPDVAATLEGLYGAAVPGSLTLRPAWWAASLAMTLGGTCVAGAGAIWKVAHLPVLAPAQPRAWARASSLTLRLQSAVGALLIAVSLLIGIVGSGLVSGFILLGSLLLSAALLLPLWLSVCLDLGARAARGSLAQWFWADTHQQMPGLSIALMALLLALAANIGVGTMVQSFRLTFTGWLDQRLASELYVEARDEAEAQALVEWLDPRAEALLPIWSTETQILGAPGEIYGIADHTTYRENWPLLSSVPNVWGRLATGGGILVNEQLARREDLSPGDPIRLAGWETTVAGIYSDYGNPIGQVLVAVGELERFDNVERLNFGIRTDAPDALALRLRDEFGLGADQIVDQASLKSLSLQIFERTFAVTSVLNVLTLGIAAMAILTSLLTLATQRLPQLAPVWALGLTQVQLGRLELVRSLVLAALTFVVAVPVGLLLAWVLLTVINVEAFGWRLPFHVFPADWLMLGLLTVFAAALASIWPAYRLATRPASDLIKVFAHER